MPICECGCDEEVFKDKWRRLPRFKLGHSSRGKFNAQWKNGSYINHEGYRLVLAYGHPRAQKNYVFEHILIAEKKIGRYISVNEHIHHINGDKLDNRLENLEVKTASEHSTEHCAERYDKIRKEEVQCACGCGTKLKLRSKTPSGTTYKRRFVYTHHSTIRQKDSKGRFI
jgi:hypothetical protein